MVSPLEALDDALESTTRETVGDTISYKPTGGVAADILAIVDYGDETERFAGTRLTTGEVAVEIPLSIAPTRDATAEFVLPKRPGETFVPKQIQLDETGMNWLVVLKKKP